MPIYSGQIEFKNKTTGANANPSSAPTISAVQGITKGAAAVDLNAASAVILADRTGVYRLEFDTGATVYDYLSFTLTNTDPDFALSGNTVADIVSDNTGTTIPALIAALPTAAEVWANPERTLTSFGELIAGIWTYFKRTLTSVGKVSVVQSVTPDGRSMQVIIGDDYNVLDGSSRSFTWTYGDWPDLTGATSIKFYSEEPNLTGIDVTATVFGAGEQTIQIPVITSEKTQAAKVGKHNFYIEAILQNSRKITLVRGQMDTIQRLD